MIQKYIKTGLVIVGSILILSGCASKDIAQSHLKIKKIHIKNALYVEYNLTKDKFTNIRNNVNTSKFIGFRLNDLQTLGDKNIYYKRKYRKNLYTSEYDCSNKKFGVEQLHDTGETIYSALNSLGLGIIMGQDHWDDCLLNSQKYEVYIPQWLSKKKVNKEKILSLYSKLLKLYTKNHEYMNQINVLLNFNLTTYPKLNLNCNIDSCVSYIAKKNKKLNFTIEENQNVINELKKLKKPYTSHDIMMIASKINYTYDKEKLNKKAKTIIKQELEYKEKLIEKAKLLAKKEKQKKEKQKEILRKKILKFIKNNYFNGEWENVKWYKGRNNQGWPEGEGSYDKDGWPDGEGVFYLRNVLKWFPIEGNPDVTADVIVEVTIKNHKFLSGKVQSFVSDNLSVLTKGYTQTFNGKDDMYKATKETYDKAIHAYNNYVYRENHPHGGSVTIKNCHDTNDEKTMCDLYINGSQDGNIYYYYKNNRYEIFILGSSKAEFNAGGYNPRLKYISTANCENSSLGSVNSINQALEMYANCSVNGHY